MLTPRAVGPGDTVAVPVSIRLPETPGAKSFQVAVGEADPSGMLTRVLDTQIFANLAEIISEIPVVPPGPAPTLSPTAQQLAAQFRDALGTPSVTVSPQQVTVGQSVRAFVQVPNNAPFTFSPQLRLFLLDPNRQQVRSLVDQRLNIPRTQPIVRQVDINTTGLTPDRQYGLRLSLIDPATGLVLLEPLDVMGLFRVVSAAAPPAPPGIPGITQLTLGSVIASPSVPRPGDTVRFDVPLALPAGAPSAPQLRGDIFILDANNRQVFRLLPEQDFTPPLQLPAWDIPDSQAPGFYGLRVRIWDPQNLRQVGFLIDTRVADLLRVEPVLVAPAPIPPIEPEPPPSPPPPEPAQSLRPGDVTIGSPVADRGSIEPGQATSITIPLTGPAPRGIPPTSVRLAVNILNAQGRAVGRTPDANPIIREGRTVNVNLVWRSSDSIAPGNYGASIRVWDPNTINQIGFLAERRVDNVITVRTAPAPAPAPAPTPAPVPTPAPTPQQGIRPGELLMFPPTAQPLTVSRTQIVTLAFSVNNQSGLS
ncbi:MAG: hypothetical protein ACE5Q6_26570, partial [Dehalococcoidia bacterium]